MGAGVVQLAAVGRARQSATTDTGGAKAGLACSEIKVPATIVNAQSQPGASKRPARIPAAPAPGCWPVSMWAEQNRLRTRPARRDWRPGSAERASVPSMVRRAYRTDKTHQTPGRKRPQPHNHRNRNDRRSCGADGRQLVGPSNVLRLQTIRTNMTKRSSKPPVGESSGPATRSTPRPTAGRPRKTTR
jgi:hypothetical protein